MEAPFLTPPLPCVIQLNLERKLNVEHLVCISSGAILLDIVEIEALYVKSLYSLKEGTHGLSRLLYRWNVSMHTRVLLILYFNSAYALPVETRNRYMHICHLYIYISFSM